jgi:CheY-like chemotaxis protein
MADKNSIVLSGRRFMIAEDEIVIAMLLEDVIEQLGGQVGSIATSCDKALAAFDSGTFDAIILDVHLEGGTSEAIIAVAVEKGIPVLVSTGSDPQTLPPAFQKLPILKKPWHSHEVEIALAQIFGLTA